MKNHTILLKSVVDVKNFVNITNCYDFDIDLESGRYIVDGKSIMGIFSLDLSKPIKVHIHADDDVAQEFEKKILQFEYIV